MDGQVENLVAIARSEEGPVVEVFGSFPGALDALAVGGFGVVLEVKRTMGGGPSCPARLKVLRGNGLERPREVLSVAHGNEEVEGRLGRYGVKEFLGATIVGSGPRLERRRAVPPFCRKRVRSWK